MNTPSQLSENLRRRLKLSGISQKGLAVKAGLNETAVRDIIQGRSRDPQYNTLRAIVRVLGCSVEDLYQDTGLPASGFYDGGRLHKIPLGNGAVGQRPAGNDSLQTLRLPETPLPENGQHRLIPVSLQTAGVDPAVWEVPAKALGLTRRALAARLHTFCMVVAPVASPAAQIAAGDRLLVDLAAAATKAAGFYLIHRAATGWEIAALEFPPVVPHPASVAIHGRIIGRFGMITAV